MRQTSRRVTCPREAGIPARATRVKPPLRAWFELALCRFGMRSVMDDSLRDDPPPRARAACAPQPPRLGEDCRQPPKARLIGRSSGQPAGLPLELRLAQPLPRWMADPNPGPAPRFLPSQEPPQSLQCPAST